MGPDKNEGIMAPSSEGGSLEEAAGWIQSTAEEVRLGKDVLKLTMDLPSFREVAPERLPDVLRMVLEDFTIRMPDEVVRELVMGTETEFSFQAPAREPDLRVRTVDINIAPHIRSLFIRGETPLDGADGQIEVFFDYDLKPGEFLENGTIDFREINRFPQAQEGDRLLRIHLPTPGVPGTDVYGFGIGANPGTPFKLDIGEAIRKEEGFDEEANRGYVDLYAEQAGIVVCEFDGQVREASRLKKISIKNQLVITNVDFSTGNLGSRDREIRCIADVTVHGDIRGHFSVSIDGSLEVKGAVEGEIVEVSKSFVATYVTSTVHAGRSIEVGTALNSTLVAGEAIMVHRECARSRLEAPQVLLKPKSSAEVLCGQASIFAQEVTMDRVHIRNVVQIEVGTDLLAQLAELDEERKLLLQTVEATTEVIKQKIGLLGERMKVVQPQLDEEGQKVLQALRTLLTMMLKGELGAEKVHQRIEEVTERCGPELVGVVRMAQQVVVLQEKKAENLAQMDAGKEKKKGILDAMGHIKITIQGILWASGKLVIRCGSQELAYQTAPQNQRENLKVQLRFEGLEGLASEA